MLIAAVGDERRGLSIESALGLVLAARGMLGPERLRVEGAGGRGDASEYG
jgi:hypothetical protein